MLGVPDDDVEGTPRARVAQVMQGAGGDSVTPRPAPAVSAPARRVVAASPLNPRLGKVLDAGDALGNVRDILTWPRHGSPFAPNGPAPFLLRLLDPSSAHPWC
jgi:hypothetical protein